MTRWQQQFLWGGYTYAQYHAWVRLREELHKQQECPKSSSQPISF